MNLIKRIKNLWKLSAVEPNRYIVGVDTAYPDQPEVYYEHKQPIIIKRTTPVDKFLNQDAK